MRDGWIRFLVAIKTRTFKILMLFLCIALLIRVLELSINIYALKTWYAQNASVAP